MAYDITHTSTKIEKMLLFFSIFDVFTMLPNQFKISAVFTSSVKNFHFLQVLLCYFRPILFVKSGDTVFQNK